MKLKESQYEGTANLIQYNMSIKPRIIPFKAHGRDEEIPYFPHDDENGFSVLKDIPKALARKMLRYHSDRYHLFETSPIMVHVTNPQGAAYWVTHYPWSYKVSSVLSNAKHSNGEYKHKKVVTWTEHKDGKYEQLADAPVAKAEVAKPVVPKPKSKQEVIVEMRKECLEAGATDAEIDSVIAEYRKVIKKKQGYGFWSKVEFAGLCKKLQEGIIDFYKIEMAK